MILIGISGKRGSGKDTLAKIFKDKYDFIHKSFAEELKACVRRDFNLTKEYTDGKLKEQTLPQYIKSIFPLNAKPEDTCVVKMWTPRTIMIEYGQFFRQFDKLWWVKKLWYNLMNLCHHPNLRVIISDVRFENEADYIREQSGIMIRLERKPELNIYGPDEIKDISETDLDSYVFDHVLNKDQNLTPKDLEKFAERIVNNATKKVS